ncbi:nuclear transport factor 2 family protein [uncultured Flavobacterium sp.]|uniref:nuclear transport factor 2 family protein n=1 Tax=uncultured Flavobacterium sp. TaxID=165435 RepID=UPI0025DDB03C|nr:nuclear transport factor 2 family protein [uncultured Flavobacterium sp.]
MSIIKNALANILLFVAVVNTCSQTENQKLKNTEIMKNTEILLKANQLVREGKYEEYLTYLTEDSKWEFVGERTLLGKEAVRQYIKEFYLAPPLFDMERSIEQGDFVTAVGNISLKSEDGTYSHYRYCDIWRFENGKLAEVTAYVIEKKP